MPVVEVDGRQLKLSNLDKVLYPTGFTKAEVIDYYAKVAPTILAHLGDRYVTRRRFPNGVEGQTFYEKNCPSHRPEWIDVNHIEGEDGTIDFCRIDSPAALVWLANLAALELHTSMSRTTDYDTPTMVVFDLDPGLPADLIDCCEVALWLRHVLGSLGLECVAKSSGSKGLQVYLPLNTPTDYEATAGFSRTLAQVMEQHHPDRCVSVQRKDLRVGKVLIDWLQNSRFKTTVCAYSLRARPRPTVSTPVTWDEVEACLETRDPEVLTFEAPEVLDRIAEHGDLWAPTLTLEQRLPAL